MRFEVAMENESLIPEHISRLEHTTKNVLMLAMTSITEPYIRVAGRLFEKFIVFSKDTLSFKCEECTSADLFW